MTPAPKKTLASIVAGTAAAAAIVTGIAYGDQLLPTGSTEDTALVEMTSERRIFEAQLAAQPALTTTAKVDATKIAKAKRRAEARRQRAEEAAQARAEAQIQAAAPVRVTEEPTATPAVSAAVAEEPASQASPYGDEEYDEDEYEGYDDDEYEGYDDDDEYEGDDDD